MSVHLKPVYDPSTASYLRYFFGGTAYNEDRHVPSSLQSVAITESVTTLGDYAFMASPPLKMSSSLTRSHRLVFMSDRMRVESICRCPSMNLMSPIPPTYVRYYFGGTQYNYGAISNSLRIEITNQLTALPSYAFYLFYYITEVILPESVSSIGYAAFQGNRQLETFSLPSNVTTIGTHAFRECYKLPSLVFPEGLTTIGSSAFFDCRSMLEVHLPSTLISIGDGAFKSCTGVTDFTMAYGLQSIGKDALQSMTSVTSIHLPGSVQTLGDTVFSGMTALSSLTVDADSEYFKAMDGILYDDAVETLIRAVPSLSGTVTLPETITTIVFAAFSWCDNISELILPGRPCYHRHISLLQDDRSGRGEHTINRPDDWQLRLL